MSHSVQFHTEEFLEDKYLKVYFFNHLKILSQSPGSNYGDYESWNVELDSSGPLDSSAESNILTASDSDRLDIADAMKSKNYVS